MSSGQLLAGAVRLRDAGLSVLAIRADGSKAPAMDEWKSYQERQPTEIELGRWFGNGARRGIGIISGKVSGNLEILDHDAPDLIAEWRDQVEGASPGLLARLPQVETPSGGIHVFYRCETIEGNKKLAERATIVPDEELPRDAEGVLNERAISRAGIRKENGIYFKVETLIETRGEGGYVVTAGSPPACHRSGKIYRMINGDLKVIPTITAHEREILLTCARSLNEFIKPSRQIAPDATAKSGASLKPGEDFNCRGDVHALLEKYDWKRLGKGRLGEKWQRPGGDHQSATLFENGSLYVFSSNAYPLEPGCSYSPFAIFALLEHAGDFQAAAKALAAQGYGESKKAAAPKNAKARSQSRVGDITFTTIEAGKGNGLPGVWATDADGNRTFVCSPLTIEADTRDEHGENWGRLLGFVDRDGVKKRWAMPMALLAGDGREFREQLLSLGLDIAPGTKSRNLLNAYLNTKPQKKAFCVTKQGWHRGAFVLPDATIGADDGEPIYLQTISANHLFREKGTVEDWREQIGRLCAGNSRLTLAVSVAFAALLLDPLQGENGGWHFTAPSSSGKTTALLVAGSVHGGGSDRGFIRPWRATINGLETVAETHHDALLCLDEIAECRPDDVNEAAYMLANGQGKTRQSRGGALRRTLEWRLTFLSSGEISIADHVAQSGKRVRAGQEVRVINLPADAEKGLGLFEDLHDFASADEFARHLQRASRDCYGSPIRAFLRQVVGNEAELLRRYRVFETELLQELLTGDAASEVSRVAHRFALVAFAGELATEYGITGWQPDDATAAAKTLFQAWLEGRGTSGSSDEENALRQVRRFIELHGQSRFQRLYKRVDSSGDETSSEERTVVNRAGFVEQADEEGLLYYVLPEVFRSEVCAGFNPTIVARALNDQGCLLTNHGYQYQKRTPEGVKKVYAIRSAVLE